MSADQNNEIRQAKETINNPNTGDGQHLMAFPQSESGAKDYLSSVKSMDDASSKNGEGAPKAEQHLPNLTLGLYLEPGTTADVSRNGDISIRPMNPQELARQKQRQEYEKTSEYQKEKERIMRQFR